MCQSTTTQTVEKIHVAPAAGTWTDPMPESKEEQLEFFKREGFLIIRNLLSPDEVAELKQELDRLALNHESLPRIREGYDLEPDQGGERKVPAFRKIGGITDLSDAFSRLMHHERVLDVLHPLMGPKIQLWRDVCMMKPARVGREKPWHQDSSYWPWEPMNLISAMTALDDATPENGCLQVIPRTHLEALQHYGGELRVDIEGDMQERTVYVPLKAGDCLLFHSLLLHGSEPNPSENDRRVCIISYKNDRVDFIGKGEERACAVVSTRPDATWSPDKAISS